MDTTIPKTSLILIGIIFLLNGCAHSGLPFLRNPSSREGFGVVYIYRPSSIFASIQSPLLSIDGKDVLLIYNGGYARLEMSAGLHILRVKTLSNLNYGKGRIQVVANREQFLKYVIEPELRFKAAFCEMFASGTAGKDIWAGNDTSVVAIAKTNLASDKQMAKIMEKHQTIDAKIASTQRIIESEKDLAKLELAQAQMQLGATVGMAITSFLITKYYKPDPNQPLILQDLPEDKAIEEISKTNLIGNFRIE